MHTHKLIALLLIAAALTTAAQADPGTNWTQSKAATRWPDMLTSAELTIS